MKTVTLIYLYFIFGITTALAADWQDGAAMIQSVKTRKTGDNLLGNVQIKNVYDTRIEFRLETYENGKRESGFSGKLDPGQSRGFPADVLKLGAEFTASCEFRLADSPKAEKESEKRDQQADKTKKEEDSKNDQENRSTTATGFNGTWMGQVLCKWISPVPSEGNVVMGFEINDDSVVGFGSTSSDKPTYTILSRSGRLMELKLKMSGAISLVLLQLHGDQIRFSSTTTGTSERGDWEVKHSGILSRRN